MTHSPLSKGRQFEQLARELHDLAFDYDEPSRSTQRSDVLIARGEDIADRVRAVVRGRAPRSALR